MQMKNESVRPFTRKARAARPVVRNPWLNLPIATQLTLGFLVAALIAALGAGAAGFQQAQSLGKQSSFYQSLLSQGTQLNGIDALLQGIRENLQLLATASTTTTISNETFQGNVKNLQSFAPIIDSNITTYTQHDLLSQHPEQKALLQEGGNLKLVSQQNSLTSSLLRAWQVYEATQTQLLGNVTATSVTLDADALKLERLQAEPTIEDTISALRALTHFNNRIAQSIQDAAKVEAQQQTITTIIATISVFLGIAIVGWLISRTLVSRLTQLRQVTLAVEDGHFGVRAQVGGRDELARVATAINGMLDTIVGLLEETRRQRDALTTAADRLFSDMRLAGAGDLRVNASVTNDPVGMLGNAFNLTIGRFRRFILRTQTVIEQLDVVARRETQRTRTFFGQLQGQRSTPLPPTGPHASQVGQLWETNGDTGQDYQAAMTAQVGRARELLNYLAREAAPGQVRALLEYAEEAYLSVNRLNQLVTALMEARSSTTVGHLAQLQIQELTALESTLRRLGTTAFATQKNSTAGMNELNSALGQIAQTARQPGSVNRTGIQANHARTPETVQAIGSFAQDMAEMSQELVTIVQELRAGITPFRLENTEMLGAYPVAD